MRALIAVNSPLLQIAAHGAAVLASADELTACRAEFAARRSLRLVSLIEPRLLSRIQAQVAAAVFVDRAHGSISTELCMQRNVCLGVLNFLVNDPVVFKFVEEVTGCRTLKSFVGRVYRLCANLDHYDSWHGDLGHDVGMSVNLGAEVFEGGVFEIRRVGTAEPTAAIANVVPGDAILFAIGDDLEHRNTPMRGPVAKTAFAGWFGPSRDYRDIVHQRMQPGGLS